MPPSKENWALGAAEANTALGVRKIAGAPNAVIGAGCRIIGDLELDGDVRIDGAVEGELKVANGHLVIGESALINAKIFGRTVSIFGRVDGDVICRERLEIHAGACVTGSITSPRLIIEDGVVFEGMCQMSEAQAEQRESSEKIVDITIAVSDSAAS